MQRLNIFFCVFLLLFPTLLIAQTETAEEPDVDVEETGGIYPSESQGSDTNTIEADRGKIGDFPQPERPEFTGQLKIASQTQNEIRPNYYVLEGYVDIQNEGIRLQADRAEYDATKKDLIAVGNVVLDQDNQHLTGDRLELNMETKKGVMYNARGFVPPQIFFWGTKLEKLGEDEYRIHDGVFTECSQLVPHWRLNTSRARMTLNEYIHFRNFTLKAKKIPVFYSPYMMWPIQRERSTGFLFPSFGPNSRKGFWLGGSFFWAMNRSMDSTYWLDHYAIRGWGGGAEYRYAAGKESNGFIKTYVARDRELGTQWTATGAVKQDLPADWRVAGIVDWFSSFEYIRDYATTIAKASSQTKTAQLFFTRNWSYYSLNTFANYKANSATSTNYHLPELEFRAREQQLPHTPFYWTLLTSANRYGQGITFEGQSENIYLQRYDVFPGISWPITYLSWLTLTPTFGQRWTHYTKQHVENKANQVIDEPLTRDYSDLSLDLRGPNFGKVFDTPGLAYSKKWKHAIEPQITYRWIQNIPESDSIFLIDDVDSARGLKQVTYSLTNLLYAKRPVKEEREYESDEYQYYNPKPLEEEPESVWEFISWRVSQSYRFDSDSFNREGKANVERFSDVSSDLRISPNQSSNVQFNVDYNLKFRQLTQIQLTSTLRKRDRWHSALVYNYSNPAPDEVELLPGFRRLPAGNSLQTNGGFGFWKNRLVLNGGASYDITNKEVLTTSFGATWNDDCFSVGVQYRLFGDVYRINGKERQITFSFSLPNIGNLVSYDSGNPPGKY